MIYLKKFTDQVVEISEEDYEVLKKRHEQGGANYHFYNSVSEPNKIVVVFPGTREECDVIIGRKIKFSMDPMYGIALKSPMEVVNMISIVKNSNVPADEALIFQDGTCKGKIMNIDTPTQEEEEAFNSMPATTIAAEEKDAVAGIHVTDSNFAAFDAAKLDKAVEALEFKRPLVIYHGNCADGFSAAWVFHHVEDLIEAKFDFHAGVYGEEIPDVDNRIVYIVDFSYKRDKMIQICEKADRVYWLDHHVSAGKELLTGDVNDIRSMFPGKVEVVFDIDKSGATIAWAFWQAIFDIDMGEMPKLLAHVEDRDLWRFRLPFTREIQTAVFAYEYTFENWDRMMGLTDTGLTEEQELKRLRDAGIMLERKHHKDIAELVKVCQRYMNIGGVTVPVASLPYTLSSDAGHLMAKNHKDGTEFAACYWDTEDARIFSLRSTENGMDVSVIAQEYGGGGHKNAAGFKVPRNHSLAAV